MFETLPVGRLWWEADAHTLSGSGSRSTVPGSRSGTLDGSDHHQIAFIESLAVAKAMLRTPVMKETCLF